MTAILCFLFAVGLWWLGTGVVLRLSTNLVPRSRGALSAALAAGLAGLAGVAWSASMATVGGVLLAFACALVIWGAVELGWLLGHAGGVHRAPCPPECTQGRRFVLAAGALIYHELTVLGAGAAIAVATAGADNKVALWAYVTLALMRWSAKLNLFLGVPVFHREWLPAHLHHVATYVRRRAMNPLFPLSITAATAAAAWVLDGALGVPAGSFAQASHVLVATLIALGLLEHWCLVVPLGEARLWKWALGTRDEAPRLAPWPQASRLSGARPPLPPG